MKKEQEKRRSFLRHILAGSVVVAGATLSTRKAKAKGGLKVEPPSGELYHESDDFKKYYKSLRS